MTPAQAPSGQRGGGGEQPVLLCVEGAVHDSGADVVRRRAAQRTAERVGSTKQDSAPAGCRETSWALRDGWLKAE